MSCLENLDAVVLQHALAAIDDWDLDIVSIWEDLSKDASLPNPTTKRPRPQRSFVPYKPRNDLQRKLEVELLREQVEKLQQTIAYEQAKQVTQSKGDLDALECECKDIVTRQSRQRIVAQMRNNELRKLLDDSRRDADKIRRLGRRLFEVTKAVPRNLSSFTIPNYQGPQESPQIQLLRLPGLHQEATCVFTRGAFADRSSERCKVFREVALHESLGTFEVVFETAWVLPFAVEDVVDALWIQTTRVMTNNNQIKWLDVHADGASVVSQFVSVPTDDANQTIKCGQIATHRECLDNGRTQVVSNVQVKALDGPTGISMYNSDVWVRVEPIASSPRSPVSQVLWCRRVRLQPPASHCQTPSKKAQWLSTILTKYTSTLRAREESMLTCNIQAMENRLVINASKRNR